MFLQGGPGFGNPEPQDSTLTRYVLNRGYQILFLDYRGVGLSTPVTADTIPKHVQEQVAYLKLFRQDNNVRDLEAVRMCLTSRYEDHLKKWSIFGQSFGGFVCLSYLSKHPEGLREVFMTGGLAPISSTPEEVYTATFQKVKQRNMAYYRKFGEDVEIVRKIAKYLHHEGTVTLPAGGNLTCRRFLTLGHMFGLHGGLDAVHSMVLRMNLDLSQFGFLTRPTLAQMETYLPFDTAPIYAVLHEAIYCYKKGVASNWAAQRVGQELAEFSWLSSKNKHFEETLGASDSIPICFSGEMVFPFMFADYPDLVRMKEAADILAEYDQWDDLYDEEQLRRNTVPTYAASFVEDMYVENELARRTAAKVSCIRVLETNTMYHNALRAKADEVLSQLFKLRDDTID